MAIQFKSWIATGYALAMTKLQVKKMNLHEYQAKQLLSQYGISVSKGEVANSVEDAVHIADKLKTSRWVVKAQVHAGGRGRRVVSNSFPPRMKWLQLPVLQG